MSKTNGAALPQYKPADFTSDQDVRWCPGCGDYAVLTGVRKALAVFGGKKEDYVFVSGIGCAARFPYYLDTYGMHTIHGRAVAVATGVKLANPGLEVCVVSGDGDLLSIGGNHTLHAMRRNVDLTVVLLNNRIYGLTKGQYSPTSEVGKITKSTPMGSLDAPVNPLSFALASGATFVARSLDVDVKLFESIYSQGVAHPGFSFIEVYQDCNIFNHAAFFYASQKENRADNTIALEHGKPMVFGASRNKGLRRCPDGFEVVELGNGISEDDLVVHNENDRSLAFRLSQMRHPEFPEALGVLYRNDSQPTYDAMVHNQIAEARRTKPEANLESLLLGDETWDVG